MPKAELHLHLDGSLRVDTALDIARTRRVEAPATFAGMRAVLVGPEQVSDQAELLLAFDLPIALMQDAEALERVAADLVEDKACDHVRYMEIRWAPLLHTRKGLTGRQVVEAVWRGAHGAARRHGVDVRLIATLMRSHAPEANLDFVLDMVAGGRPGRAGRRGPRRAGGALPGPGAPPRRDRHGARPGAPRHAARRRVGRCGAGQAGADPGAGADRARPAGDRRPGAGPGAHRRGRSGSTSAPPPTTRRGIVPTFAEHPFRRLLQAGVKVTLNTDDLTVSDITLSEEYARAVERLGVTLPELWAVNTAAIEAAFCGEPTKEDLREEFLAWSAGIPELIHR